MDTFVSVLQHVSQWGSLYCILPSKDRTSTRWSRGSYKQQDDSPSQIISQVLQSLLKCHFLLPLLPCPFAQVLNRHTIVCWSGASIPPPVSTSSLMEARGKRAICLEQHSHFYTKIAETEKRCADLCKIHSRTLMNAIDCNLLAKFQGGTSMGTAFHLVVVFVAVVIFGAQSLYSDKHL